MAKVELVCPDCSKRGHIEIEENLINKSERGISAVNVAEDLICSHSFVAYIDKNLAVRDCFLTDFKIELPEIELEQKLEEVDLPDTEKIDVYLISINLNAIWLTYVIRGCFNKKKILILNDREFLYSHFMNFFEFIFKDSFKIDISFENKESYKNNKKNYKDYLIIDGGHVLNDKDKILKPKMIKIESSIVQKFLGEIDPKSSLIIIRNEIQKAYELSKDVIDFNNNLGENEELPSKKVIDNFIENRNIKIQSQYMNFLIEIVKNYFETEISMSSDVSDFLGF